MSSRLKRKGLALVVAATACATALGTATVASAAPSTTAKAVTVAPHGSFKGDSSKLVGLDKSSPQRVAVYIQFKGEGAAAASRRSGARAAVGRRASVERQATDVAAAARRADAKASRLYVTTNALPGVAMLLDAKAIAAVARRADVVKVSRIVPKTAENANTASFVKALNTWKFNGGLGKGVRVAVIDTGLDYTHADFGGPGTPAAYDAESPTNSAWLQQLTALGKAKVAGGFDFAGDAYNADPDDAAYSPNPVPDPSPLDCNGHGTHVSGTTLGYGVNAKGKTFTGKYAKLTAPQLMAMEIGPGMAPAAKVYGYKVFGCEGSTNLVGQALDRSLDPNGDGNFSDHVDIINMSLGSSYGPVDDPENAIVAELSKYGVLTVASQGNEGDLTDVGGTPGSSPSALTVASSVDSYQLLDGLKVNAPANVAGVVAGQFSVAYDWATEPPVTGDVVKLSEAGNDDGCGPLNPADAAAVNGKVAWLTWDSNDATRECGSVGRSGNVAAAGAIGAIFTGDVSPFAAGITGSAVIPVLQLTKNATAKLQPAVDAGTLNVTFDGALLGSNKDIDPTIADLISGFTSRGAHGSLGVVKPDVTAPGDSISSAGVGSGNAASTLSGTSMASPLTAGVAALVKGKHPGWKPLKVKAAVVNTAQHDLFTDPGQTGHRYSTARIGSGRVDALAAFETQALAYVEKQGMVNASFGVVPAPVTQASVTKTVKVKVANTGKKATKFTTKYSGINNAAGVSYSVKPAKLTVGPGRTKTVTVTMKVKPSALTHSIDPTMATEQIGVPRQFVSDSSGRLLVKPGNKKALRVAVYGAAKPVSTTTAAVSGGQIAITGQGVDQGVDAESYLSMASVMTFGATSDALPLCDASLAYGDGTCVTGATERGGDLKAVGAGANADWLWFGVSTHGDWASVGNVVIPFVDYDVNGDGDADYETFVQNYPDTDVLLAITVDLETGDTIDMEPVNFQFGDVDTNVFDTNTVLLPVWKETFADGTVPVTGDISYTVGTFNAYSGAVMDTADSPAPFNAVTPAFSVDEPLYVDAGGSAIDYTYTGTAPTKALVFHLHGAKGARDQILDIPAP